MSQYLNKKKIRNSLINYFKLIAKSQKEIQSIQQKLVLHPRFQPIVLFRKIAGCDNVMDLKELKQYFRRKIGIKRQEGIKMYILKYGLQGDFISCETFLETLLPYTPNTLRDVNQTITRQLQTQHLDLTVQQLYHQLIRKATQSLFIIRLFQQFITLKTWQKVQNFMAQDLNEKGKKIDLMIKQQIDVIYIRKWMQLWVEEVDEYEVLNLMRFFGGGAQKNILNLFNNDVKISSKCTCGCMKQIRQKNDLNQDYYTSTDSNTSRQQFRFHTQSNSIENLKSKSSAKSLKSKDYNQSSPTEEFQQISTFLPRQEDKMQEIENLQLSKFKNYLVTLIESQKYLDFNRLMLIPYKKQCDQILHDLLNKKSNSTSIQRILLYIEKYLSLKKQRFDKLLQEVGNSKVQNRLIFSVFCLDAVIKSINKNGNGINSKKLSLIQILQVISYILYNFILTKNKLIKLSSQMFGNSTEELLKNVIKKIGKDQNARGIKTAELKDFLSLSIKKSIGKKYLELIMVHLGDGNQITPESLQKAFLKQSKKKLQINNLIDKK